MGKDSIVVMPSASSSNTVSSSSSSSSLPLSTGIGLLGELIQQHHADHNDHEECKRDDTKRRSLLYYLMMIERSALLNCTLPSENWSRETEPFKIRSKSYLKDKKKIVCEESMFHLVAVDFIELDEHAKDVPKTLQGGVAHRYLSLPGPKPFLFIVNFMLPGDKNMSFIAYFVAKPGMLEESSSCGNLFKKFISGTDAFRQSRFKFIPQVSKGPFLVRSMVGSTPAILGNKLTQTYHSGDGYFEVCVDVGSSTIGGSALKLVKGYLTCLTFDMAFLLEAQTEEELPEVCLGTLRFSNVDLKMAQRFVPSHIE
jgi:hypothetical protein